MYRYRHVCLHIGIMAICGHSVYITVMQSRKITMKLTKQDLRKQSYLGKDLIMQYIDCISFKIDSVEKITVIERLRRNKSFINRQKKLTEHVEYVIHNKSSELKYLKEHKDSTPLLYYICKTKPYYVFGVIVLESTGEIINSTKGFEFTKTPEEIWAKAWGNVNA